MQGSLLVKTTVSSLTVKDYSKDCRKTQKLWKKIVKVGVLKWFQMYLYRFFLLQVIFNLLGQY